MFSSFRATAARLDNFSRTSQGRPIIIIIIIVMNGKFINFLRTEIALLSSTDVYDLKRCEMRNLWPLSRQKSDFTLWFFYSQIYDRLSHLQSLIGEWSVYLIKLIKPSSLLMSLRWLEIRCHNNRELPEWLWFVMMADLCESGLSTEPIKFTW